MITKHPRMTLTTAFIAGILLTLGFKDLYPYLKHRIRRQRWRSSPSTTSASVLGEGTRKVTLEDNSASNHLEVSISDISEGIEGCIGDTPLIRIKSLSEATGCEILGKAEFLNGAGNSPKDRVALSMIQMAEEEGLLTPHSGDAVYEGTVGSTGISSTFYPAPWILLKEMNSAHTLLIISCMPDDQATEKSDLLLKLGAKVERVRPASIVDQNQFVNKARSRAAEHTADPSRQGRGFFADQFEKTANWRAHHSSTGPEIYRQCGGHLDAFVAGAGTGGTISGCALFLKPKLPNMKVVLADPQGSGLFNRI
ncbi:hypothetical protein B0A49_05400, partial [Cryomyces minteri]